MLLHRRELISWNGCYIRSYAMKLGVISSRIHFMKASSLRREYHIDSLCVPVRRVTSRANKLFLMNLSENRNSNENYLTEIHKNFIKLYPVESWKKYGFYTDDYLKIINVHWLKFEPPESYNHYLLAGLYCIFMVVGLSGNFTVIFLYLRCKSLHTPANTLTLNLAVSDFLMMSKTPLFIYNSMLLGPALGSVACELYGFIGGLSGTVSICTLATISLDRYYVIKYPLKKSFSHLRIRLYIVITWLYGITFSSIPLLDIGCGKYVPEGYLTSCSFDYLTESQSVRKFIWVYFVAAWVTPLIIIAYSYFNILILVLSKRKVTRESRSINSQKHIKEGEIRRQEIKLSFIVFITISLWFLSWTPYAVVALLGITRNFQLITPFSSMIPALFCKMASCIDPFIYALNHPRFREEFNSIFCRRITRKTRKLSKMLSVKSDEENFDSDIYNPSCVSEIIEIEFKDITKEPVEENQEEQIKNVSSAFDFSPNKNTNKRIDIFSLNDMIIPFYAKILRPNFKNRTSKVRRLAHRLSLKSQKSVTKHSTRRVIT